MGRATISPGGLPMLDIRVSHPLDRLRGTIRRYVLVEGLLSAAVFVAAWFGLGLLFDFGLFKVATWDWVADAPRWLRSVALIVACLLLAAIVALRIVRRLTKDLSYPALALVLERRFPEILGDHLITAVELADVEAQTRYGYSRAMILRTIDEARERVATVPVDDAFNWRRLRVLGTVAVGLLLAVVATGFAAYSAATNSLDPYRFAWRFAHVSSIFLERNALLMDTQWPRRAHLELVEFAGSERRIGKDGAEPVIRAKAYRWVVADRSTPTGWRPMLWGDATESLIGGSLPALPAKAFREAADPGTLADDPKDWQLDRIQAMGLDDASSRAKLIDQLHGDEYKALGNGLERVFAALDEQAASASMGRRLRKLDLPDRVALAYVGQTKSGEVTLGTQQNQEFAAPIPELKESVNFVVKAEDFRTLPRTITLVPPPAFKTLVRTEYQPAYLYHAPPQGEGYPFLRGYRQRMPERALTLTGDRSVFAVPSGTEVVVTASADVDLTAAYVVPKVGILPDAKPGSSDPIRIPIGADGRTVSVEFRGQYRLGAGRTIDHWYVDDEGQIWSTPVATTPTVEFDLVVEQADGVSARRQLLVQVIDDRPPEVEVAIEGVRKVGNVYYATPKARIPFNPESFVRDDHGLSKVSFEVVYWPEDSEIGRALRAQLMARAFLNAPSPTAMPAAVVALGHAVNFKNLDKGDNRQTSSFGVKRFEDLKNDLRKETRQAFEQQLTSAFEDSESRVVQRLELKSPEQDYFDLDVLKLTASAAEVQTRYRLDLNISATDTNYDTGPRVGLNPEPIRVLIVSEGDLLAEINKEEESFALRLDEALAKIAGAKKKWEFVRTQNSIGLGTNNRDNLDTVKVRGQDAIQDIAKSRDIVQTVVREYRRIHRECIVNQVTEATRDKFGTFGNRIDRVLGETPPPITPEESGQVAAGLLAPKMTFPEAEKRLEAVVAALNESRWADPAGASDAEIALNALEREVSAIRKALGELQNQERLKKLLASVIEEKKRIRQELDKWRFEYVDDTLKKEPKLATIGALFLAKGETKRIKQGINWRQFQKDDVVVKLAATDKNQKPVPPDVLAVPVQLKLDFEKNDREFEYEVRAGKIEGDFTLTLTPEVGEPVAVTITVK